MVLADRQTTNLPPPPMTNRQSPINIPPPPTPSIFGNENRSTTDLENNDQVTIDPDSTDESNTDRDKPSVFCIPSDLPLSNDEKSILSKGLNFVPLTRRLDHHQQHLDLERFFRSLRWSVIVGNVPTQPTMDSDDPISRMFQRSKPTMPKTDISPAVESYISQCRSEINVLKLKTKPIR